MGVENDDLGENHSENPRARQFGLVAHHIHCSSAIERKSLNRAGAWSSESHRALLTRPASSTRDTRVATSSCPADVARMILCERHQSLDTAGWEMVLLLGAEVRGNCSREPPPPFELSASHLMRVGLCGASPSPAYTRTFGL